MVNNRASSSQPKLRAADRLRAYELWLENDKPSLRTLMLIMAAEGVKVAHTTLQKWADANPEWRVQMQARDAGKPERIMTALALAKKDASKIEVDHYIGIKASLLARLYETLQRLPLTDIDEWTRALACLNQLEALIHDERGKSVKEITVSSPVTSLMDRLTPKVAIAPFVKPKPNGGGGNGASA